MKDERELAFSFQIETCVLRSLYINIELFYVCIEFHRSDCTSFVYNCSVLSLTILMTMQRRILSKAIDELFIRYNVERIEYLFLINSSSLWEF